MFDRFTRPARVCMGKARQNAQRHRADFIEYNHVLRALLDVADGDAVKLLGDLGLEADFVARLVYLAGTVDKPGRRLGLWSTPEGQLPFSGLVKRVLEYAVEEADALDQRDIGTGHLLLGLVRGSEGRMAKLFVGLGVTLEAIRQSADRFQETVAETRRCDVCGQTKHEAFQDLPGPKGTILTACELCAKKLMADWERLLEEHLEDE